jgi:hypothetical protein
MLPFGFIRVYLCSSTFAKASVDKSADQRHKDPYASAANRPSSPNRRVVVTAYRFVRLLRTLSSEVYVIWQGDQRVGQVGVHLADISVQANLILESPMTDDDLEELVRQLDDDIVSSHLPCFDRDQFIVNVFVGQEVDSFNYPPTPEDDEIGEA